MIARELRVHVIAMAALIGGAFAYAAADWGRWPRLFYVPLSEEWTFAPPDGAIAMGYVGLVAWGFGGVVTGATAGALIARALPEAWSTRAARLFGAWALTAITLAGAYFTWQLLAV